jgi:hypothetical protein
VNQDTVREALLIELERAAMKQRVALNEWQSACADLQEGAPGEGQIAGTIAAANRSASASHEADAKLQVALDRLASLGPSDTE